MRQAPAKVAPITDLNYLGGGPGKKDEGKKEEPKGEPKKEEGKKEKRRMIKRMCMYQGTQLILVYPLEFSL